MKKINKTRKTGILVGVLFLIALFSDVISVSISENSIIMILDIISGLSIIGIGISIFPILKQHNKKLALSYSGIRIIEGLFFIFMVIFFVSKSTIMIDRIYVYLFCMGALILYYLLYRTKLVPRFISIWGIFAIILLLALNISRVLQAGSATTVLLASPLALQEFVLAIWLIVKGFNKN